mgnify:CR=1 FL=1|jgi:hypothetical protein
MIFIFIVKKMDNTKYYISNVQPKKKIENNHR